MVTCNKLYSVGLKDVILNKLIGNFQICAILTMWTVDMGILMFLKTWQNRPHCSNSSFITVAGIIVP